MAIFSLGDSRRCSEDHGAGLYATHGYGLEVADCDDLAVLHFFQRDETVEAGTYGSYDLALELGRVVGAGSVAAGDCADVEGVCVGVALGFEDVADSEVD